MQHDATLKNKIKNVIANILTTVITVATEIREHPRNINGDIRYRENIMPLTSIF
jgi:ethanolamine utilization cobalamin adenosyltransferase